MTGVATRTIACAGGMPAFVAVPDAAARTPAVIVVHERYGLVRHICDLAERFARDGFVAIAPDLYFQHPDQAALHRGDAGCDVADPDAVVALGGAIDALHAIPQADTSRLAIMGIARPARLPLVVAAARPIAAALVWYGAAQPREWAVNAKYPRALDEIIAAVDCPVLGMFGETDHLISLDDVRRPARLSGAPRTELRHPRLRRRAARLAQRHHAGALPPRPGGGRPGPISARSCKRSWAPGHDRSNRIQRYAADIAADYDFSRNVRHE